MVSFLFLTVSGLLLSSGALADECQPHTWGMIHAVGEGDVNCRHDTTTGSKVDSDTCQSIAKKYETTLDKLLDLNPGLGDDCASIKPNTTYCVDGCEHTREHLQREETSYSPIC